MPVQYQEYWTRYILPSPYTYPTPEVFQFSSVSVHDIRVADVNKAEQPHDNEVIAVADVPDLTGEELDDLVEAVKTDQLSQAYESDHESEGDWNNTFK